MESLFNGLTITEIHKDTHRNIVSLRVSQDLYDDLSASPKDWKVAIDLEMATKPHTNHSTQPIIDRPFEEAAYNEAIRYPFNNWSQSRYSDGTYGVWYGADTLETSIYETVHHWRRGFLDDAGWGDIEGVIIERKVYLVHCDAGLLDFHPKLEDFPALVDPDSYHLTHQVGARIHHEGHPGLATRSARCEGNVNAIFNPRVLTNPRDLCYLTYEILAGVVNVVRQSGEVMLRI
jgi:hypothetical protein